MAAGLINAKSLAVTPWTAGTSQHLLIADFDGSRIRSVDLATGIITTAVNADGTPGLPNQGDEAAAAKIIGPIALTVDLTGAFYFADNGAATFWKVAPHPETKVPTLYQLAGTGEEVRDEYPPDGYAPTAKLGFVQSAAVVPGSSSDDPTIWLAAPGMIKSPLRHSIRKLSLTEFNPCPVSAKSLADLDRSSSSVETRLTTQGWPWPGAMPVAIPPPFTLPK